MSDVTGPISSLPGSRHTPPDGTRCDEHPDRPAIARVQGETDSFGCEMNDLCEECLKAEREYARSPEATSGRCDWCKKDATDLRARRDYEEGMCGPVYEVCGGCAARSDARIQADLDAYDNGRDDDWDDGEP